MIQNINQQVIPTPKTKRKPMYDTDSNLFKEFDPVAGEFKDKA